VNVLAAGAEMRRREFFGFLSAVATWPLAASAQQRTPLIAILSPAADPPGPTFPENIAAFLRGLRARGYIEGQNIKFAFRFAGWKFNQSLADRRVSGALLPPCNAWLESQDANQLGRIGWHIWSTI
jgi:hypothetical protein